MGCGGSKVNAVDAESVDAEGNAQQSPGNGIKSSINEETDQKAVQFSPEIRPNGITSNDGKSSLDIKIYCAGIITRAFNTFLLQLIV